MSRLATPALTRLCRAFCESVAEREVTPCGIVTFSDTAMPLDVLPCAFASDCALAIASVMALSRIAANEANADAVAAKLRAKGYKVTKSPTSKGIRIMVGPSKDRETADSARKKINSDASLGMKSAWVIEWVPLDRR